MFYTQELVLQTSARWYYREKTDSVSCLLFHVESNSSTIIRQTFFSLSLFSRRPVLASDAFYLQTFVTLSAVDYYFKDYFKPWVVQFLTFVAKQCWPKLCLLARAGTLAWQHYLIVYSGDAGKSFQLQTNSSAEMAQRWFCSVQMDLCYSHRPVHTCSTDRCCYNRRGSCNELFAECVWLWINSWLADSRRPTVQPRIWLARRILTSFIVTKPGLDLFKL